MYCDDSVCFSDVCPLAYVENHVSELHSESFVHDDSAWSWLAPPLTALRYVTYFRFCGIMKLVYAELTMGQWVMGQIGHQFWMGHMGHGSLSLTH